MKCPDCFKTLKPLQTTCMCGWSEKPKVEIDDHLCQHMEYGVKCTKAGTDSTSIKGGGPWYCKEHFYK